MARRTLITDAFAGTLDNWDGAYTGTQTPTIIGGRLFCVSANSLNVLSYRATTVPADHWAEVTVPIMVEGSAFAGILLRTASSPTFSAYRVGIGFGVANCIKIVGGAETEFYSAAASVAAGDTLRGEVIGNVLALYKNGLVVFSQAADNTFASGQPGLLLYSASDTGNLGMDDFLAGDYEGADSPLLTLLRHDQEARV